VRICLRVFACVRMSVYVYTQFVCVCIRMAAGVFARVSWYLYTYADDDRFADTHPSDLLSGSLPDASARKKRKYVCLISQRIFLVCERSILS